MNRKLLMVVSLIGVMLATPVLAKGPHYRFDQTNTSGWTLMSAQERTEHRNKMLAAKTYDECKAIQEAHHQDMEARAKEKGVTLGAPRYNACDRMKARGFIK